jgi:outer membrane protein OmpA-like peptidoglycan-associated protein/Tol biopolymer transport system component
MYIHTSRWRFAASLIAGAIALATTVTLTSSVGATTTTRANGPIYYVKPGSPAQMKAVTEEGTAVSDIPVALQGFRSKVLSPDGTKVAWNDMVGSTSSLKVSDIDGTNEVTIASAQSANWLGLQFSADSSTVYATAGNPQLFKIFGFDASTTNQVPADKVILDPATGNSVWAFQVSRTGKIAYISGAQDTNVCPLGTGFGLFVRELNGSGAGTLVPNSCANLGNNELSAPIAVTWNLDGDLMYVVQKITSGGVEIQRTIIEQFTESGIVAGGPLFDTGTTERELVNFKLSPDGKKIAYVMIPRLMGPTAGSTDGLYVFDIASKTARQLAVLNMPSSVTWGSVAGVESTPTTTVPSTGTSTATTPGVTVTDPTVYTVAPKKVASGSSIAVLAPTDIKTQRLQSNTPDVCLPTKDDIVFIETGRCTVDVLDKKSGNVLRRLRTTVVEEDIVELGIGNEVAILAPIYFDNGSAELAKKARSRVRGLKNQISAAGTVMVVGHSGIMLGDTEENRALSRQRAINTVREMKRIRATGPFYSIGVGAIDPSVNNTSRDAQSKNRRVIIVLVP